MALTILSAFQKLKENLEITGLQKSTASTRQENVRDAIAKEMNVLDSFLTGSYARSTLISPLAEADVDIFVVLDPKYYEVNGQTNLLDKVKRTLLQKYTKTPKISRNGQAVTITFTDFIVDVVPAFNRKDGGYLIPNSVEKNWISTNPKIHVDITAENNKNHNGDLVPIIKMIKGWNKNINYSFVSFRLELLAIEIFKNITISDYSSGIRYFFDKGREGIKFKAKDPAPYGGEISGLRNISTQAEAISKFETAYNRAVKAEQYTKNGDTENAISEWKKIFGDYFPIFG